MGGLAEASPGREHLEARDREALGELLDIELPTVDEPTVLTGRASTAVDHLAEVLRSLSVGEGAVDDVIGEHQCIRTGIGVAHSDALAGRRPLAVINVDGQSQHVGARNTDADADAVAFCGPVVVNDVVCRNV